ncbi:hypothetical protein EMIT0P176_120096 [Pseudomonas sp. IT-P176]
MPLRYARAQVNATIQCHDIYGPLNKCRILAQPKPQKKLQKKQLAILVIRHCMSALLKRPFRYCMPSTIRNGKCRSRK